MVEVLLSIVILGFSVASIAEAWRTGLRALAAQATEAQIDAQIRAILEARLADEIDSLTSGETDVTVGGTSYKVAWTVTTVDLDGDAAPDTGARRIVVTLRDRSMQTIVVDHGGWVAKL
jgi:type II secretory pathway pseudopilin PulG